MHNLQRLIKPILALGDRLPSWLQNFGAGLLVVLALPPISLWPFGILGLALLYLQLMKSRGARHAFGQGWLFGFGYFLGGLYWISNALLVDGNEYLWAYPLALAALPAGLALFPALASTIFLYLNRWAHRSENTSELIDVIQSKDAHRYLVSVLAFTFVFALAEWMRGHILTGFPWNLYGYIWSDHLLILQSASLWGPFGVTFFTILTAALLADLFFLQKKFAATSLALILLIAASHIGYGYLHLQKPLSKAAEVDIKLIQPNIPQAEKWDRTKIVENFYKTLTLSAPQPQNGQTAIQSDEPLIIIWPETALTAGMMRQAVMVTALRETLALYDRPVYLLAGTLSVDKDGDAPPSYFNSLTLFDTNLTPLHRYDKHHLVPFGEYIPYGDMLHLVPIVQFDGFSAGPPPTAVVEPNIPPYLPLICYEVIFSALSLADAGGTAEWIVNVTNDAWYGNSSGPRQHLAQAKWRAVESGIPVIRVANTGISAIISPHGRIEAHAPLNVAAAIEGPLSGRTALPTPYQRNGDLFFWTLLLSSIVYISIKRLMLQ